MGMTNERNADTFVPTGWFWRAWPENEKPVDDFKTKAEACAYCKRNRGGGVQRMRYRSSNVMESRMDTIEIAG